MTPNDETTVSAARFESTQLSNALRKCATWLDENRIKGASVQGAESGGIASVLVIYKEKESEE
jgi:hypothetical protein